MENRKLVTLTLFLKDKSAQTEEGRYIAIIFAFTVYLFEKGIGIWLNVEVEDSRCCWVIEEEYLPVAQKELTWHLKNFRLQSCTKTHFSEVYEHIEYQAMISKSELRLTWIRNKTTQLAYFD